MEDAGREGRLGGCSGGGAMFGRQEEAAFNVMPWLASLPVDHLNRHYPSIEEVAWAKQAQLYHEGHTQVLGPPPLAWFRQTWIHRKWILAEAQEMGLLKGMLGCPGLGTEKGLAHWTKDQLVDAIRANWRLIFPSNRPKPAGELCMFDVHICYV